MIFSFFHVSLVPTLTMDGSTLLAASRICFLNSVNILASAPIVADAVVVPFGEHRTNSTLTCVFVGAAAYRALLMAVVSLPFWASVTSLAFALLVKTTILLVLVGTPVRSPFPLVLPYVSVSGPGALVVASEMGAGDRGGGHFPSFGAAPLGLAVGSP